MVSLGGKKQNTNSAYLESPFLTRSTKRSMTNHDLGESDQPFLKGHGDSWYPQEPKPPQAGHRRIHWVVPNDFCRGFDLRASRLATATDAVLTKSLVESPQLGSPTKENNMTCCLQQSRSDSICRYGQGFPTLNPQHAKQLHVANSGSGPGGLTHAVWNRNTYR